MGLGRRSLPVRRLALLLLFFTGAVAQGDQTRRIELHSLAGSPPRCSGTVLMTRGCPIGECADTIDRIAFAADTVVTVREEQRDALSRIAFESGDCWIAPINDPKSATALQTTAWPLATVRGTLTLLDGKAAELQALVKVEGLDGEFSEACSVRNGIWQCPIPATRVTLRLTVPGYAPRHLWDIDGRAGEVKSVGLIEFHRGATITGVLRGPAGVLPKDTQIDLVNELFKDDSTRAEPYARTRPNNGNFEFSGLPSGAYRVVARSKGLSPAESKTVLVANGSLYETGVLRLQRLIVLKLLVDPPADDQQHPWHVTLDRTASGTVYTTRVANEPVQVDGSWERPGLEAGVYDIAVADSAGGILERKRITVDENTAVVELHLNQIPVHGRLRTGSHGLAADLRFTSTGLNSGKRVSTKSDSDGFFKTILPSEGTWDVRIMQPSGHSYIIRRGIAIHRRGDSPYAEVSLDLPEGTIKGIVVDAAGKPLQKPLDVLLFRDGRVAANAASSESGEFEFFGLADGNVTLQAKSRSAGDSGLVPYDIKGEADSTVKLVVVPERTVRGVIVTAEGFPVAGAVVRFAASSSSGYGDTVAGPGGTFEIAVPERTESVTVAILAVGMPVHLAVLRVADGEDRVQEVVLTPAAGRLLIPMTPTSRMPGIGLPGGALLALSALIFPPDGSSALPQGIAADGFDIALVPGPYVVCSHPGACEGITLRQGEKTLMRSSPDPARQGPGK